MSVVYGKSAGEMCAVCVSKDTDYVLVSMVDFDVVVDVGRWRRDCGVLLRSVVVRWRQLYSRLLRLKVYW